MNDKYRGHSRSPLDNHESKKHKRDEVFIVNQSDCFGFYEIFYRKVMVIRVMEI
jgi:hypothetical protein